MRYFLEFAYNGSRFYGYQIQTNQISVQEHLETKLSLVLGEKISITGCGRTDAGVHAAQYFAHFDYGSKFPNAFISRMNKFIGPDISIRECYKVPDDAHARFDANSRSYQYYIDLYKNPFRTETSWHFYKGKNLDIELMQAALDVLKPYQSFKPFCKTGSDVKTYEVNITNADWHMNLKEEQLVLHISANRFLRGMIRLLVGECVNIALGNDTLENLKSVMDNQHPLKQALSVPPQGLFLTDIKYPFKLVPFRNQTINAHE